MSGRLFVPLSVGRTRIEHMFDASISGPAAGAPAGVARCGPSGADVDRWAAARLDEIEWVVAEWREYHARYGDLGPVEPAASEPAAPSGSPGSRSRLVRFIRAVDSAIDRVADVEPLFMSAVDKTEALVGLERVSQRLHAMQSCLIAAARIGGDVCEAGGHRDTSDLLAQATRSDRSRWAGEQKLADALERWPITQTAWSTGEISVEHARVIVRALDDIRELPEVYAAHLTAEVVRRAEEHLVELARQYPPKILRRLAGRLFEAIAPEAAEEIEAKRLALMEQRAEAAMGITIRSEAKGIEGLSEIKALVPAAVAARFKTNLEAFTNPRVTHDHRTDDQDEVTPLVPFHHADGEKICQSKRWAMAFAHLLESLDTSRLPIHGGDATTVIVTIALKELHEQLAAADLGLGQDAQRLSASQVRRLACTANIIPAVLGADSEILDLGRASRLYSRAQRRAMALRDQQCRADGCTIPAPWCEAHHLTAWSHGGNTDLADGKLLCRWHHHRAHDDRYLTQQLPNGDIRFHRRT